MRVYIFTGSGRVFGSIGDVTGANLPSRFSPWCEFKAIELSRDGEPVAGVNTGECLDDIEKHVFHITDAHVRITDSVI
jgi:serine phosphatase RsbU (regulator of sigma subunit)